MRTHTVPRIGAIAALPLIIALGVIPLAGCSPDQPAEEPPAEEQPAEVAPVPEEPSVPEEALISVQDLKGMMDAGEGLTLVDVRSRAAYTRSFIPGSVNIPGGAQFELRLREVPHEGLVVLIGAVGTDLAPSYQTLVDNDYDPASIRAVEGGVQAWGDAGYPLDSDDAYAC
ncbi:MAG: rhodanese-like domain-containing protein [Eggerthellaceae bacterium]|nr:rhodanese-like domain-containing protein [Eggerthellaceae bacterium]